MIAKTFSIKPSQVKRQWYVIDAARAPVGRVAVAAASLLIGKHKASYTPHIDGGDGVIVINAAKLRFTGNKLEQKRYYRHSGYPGNLKELTAKQMKAKDPAQIISLAVGGMLPKNKLRDVRLGRLRVFTDEAHGMEAQKPIPFEVTNGKS